MVLRWPCGRPVRWVCASVVALVVGQDRIAVDAVLPSRLAHEVLQLVSRQLLAVAAEVVDNLPEPCGSGLEVVDLDGYTSLERREPAQRAASVACACLVIVHPSE